MRHVGFAMVTAGALLTAGVFYAPPTAAMTGITSAGVRIATAELETVLTASCFRYGWHGWGNYPSCEKLPPKKRVKARRKE